jgi:hypothetical protein
MEKQVIINAILSLSSVIDSLNRAGKTESIDEVSVKLLELVKQL